MPPSFTSRPRSGESRPVSRDDDNLIIPNRTSSLHSRITQPLPGAMNQPKPGQRAPKTLTHAYMVCGVGREPSQWVKAPPPVQGKIGHMKGAVGQFWLPEILGSSPRLEQDNEIARSLHSAMRVCLARQCRWIWAELTSRRLASLTMSRFAPAAASPTASTTLSSCNKTHRTHSTGLHCEYGLVRMTSVLRRSAICASVRNRTTTTLRVRPTGSHTA